MTKKNSIWAKIYYSETDLFLVLFDLQMNDYESLNLASGIMSAISIVYLEQAG